MSYDDAGKNSEPTTDARIRGLLKEEARLNKLLMPDSYRFNITAERATLNLARSIDTEQMAEDVQRYAEGCRAVGLDPSKVVKWYTMLQQLHAAYIRENPSES